MENDGKKLINSTVSRQKWPSSYCDRGLLIEVLDWSIPTVHGPATNVSLARVSPSSRRPGNQEKQPLPLKRHLAKTLLLSRWLVRDFKNYTEDGNPEF